MTTLRSTDCVPGQMTTGQRTAEISSLLARRAAHVGSVGEEGARLDALIAAEAGISSEEAGRRVQAVEADAQRTITEATRRAREATDATERAASIGAFGTFAAPLLGVIAAVLSARWAAASGCRRGWSRRWRRGARPERRDAAAHRETGQGVSLRSRSRAGSTPSTPAGSLGVETGRQPAAWVTMIAGKVPWRRRVTPRRHSRRPACGPSTGGTAAIGRARRGGPSP